MLVVLLNIRVVLLEVLNIPVVEWGNQLRQALPLWLLLFHLLADAEV